MSNAHTNPGGPVRSGIVLGGGGARGLAQVGVLAVLEREGYPIDLLTGTSMGGLIAGIYGLLGGSQAIVDLLDARPPGEATRMSRAPRPELYESRPFRRWLRDLFAGRTFADLRWPIGLTAVDLDSGAELAITRGPVAPAIWATTAIPGIYAPVEANGRRLVDGGVLNPVPVDLARRMGATIALAVDVLPEPDHAAARMPAIYHQAMLRKFGVMSDHISKAFDILLAAQRDSRLRESPPDLLITPDLHGVSTVDYTRGPEIIERGVAAAEAVLPEIRRLRDRLLAAQVQNPNGHRPGAPLPVQEHLS
jgi:NTE family protein